MEATTSCNPGGWAQSSVLFCTAAGLHKPSHLMFFQLQLVLVQNSLLTKSTKYSDIQITVYDKEKRQILTFVRQNV